MNQHNSNHWFLSYLKSTQLHLNTEIMMIFEALKAI